MGNVILIGFMGCGKSSIAVKLSYRMKQSMVDTDRWIEKKQGKTITEIFAQDGEEAFRQMETDALEYLKEKAKNQIISVGGGLPVREENRKLMKEIEANGWMASPHAWGQVVKTHYCAHLAAAYPHHIPFIESVLGESEGVVYGGYELNNGVMTLPNKPGFGMDLIWAPEVEE